MRVAMESVCDGLGGTVKRMVDEAVRSGKCTIQDAEDFMKWARRFEHERGHILLRFSRKM